MSVSPRLNDDQICWVCDKNRDLSRRQVNPRSRMDERRQVFSIFFTAFYEGSGSRLLAPKRACRTVWVPEFACGKQETWRDMSGLSCPLQLRNALEIASWTTLSANSMANPSHASAFAFQLCSDHSINPALYRLACVSVGTRQCLQRTNSFAAT